MAALKKYGFKLGSIAGSCQHSWLEGVAGKWETKMYLTREYKDAGVYSRWNNVNGRV